MLKQIRAMLAIFVLRHSPARKRWIQHLGVYLPIFQGALENAPAEQLLTLRIMDDMAARRFPSAFRRLNKLRAYARASASEADKALFCVLLGDYYLRLGHGYEMARCMRQANRHGHRYHFPHMMLGFHYLYDRWMFDRASEEFDQAISCIYQFPPLDEGKRVGVAVMQASMSLCATMMHKGDEAQRLLSLAAPAQKTPDYLHASAALHAVAGHREEAEAALAALKEADPRRHDHWCEGIRLMLDDAHPHFTAREPDMEEVRRYWDWFLREEKILLGILADKGGHACVQYQEEHFGPLNREKPTIDMIGLGYQMEDGKPSLTLSAAHSRTSEALIMALLDACPPEISSRWLLKHCWGSPQLSPVTVNHQGGKDHV